MFWRLQQGFAPPWTGGLGRHLPYGAYVVSNFRSGIYRGMRPLLSALLGVSEPGSTVAAPRDKTQLRLLLKLFLCGPYSYTRMYL